MRLGRVYKIVHNQSDLVYIGSTFNELRFRFRDHKNRRIDEKFSITKYLHEYGAENFKIMLIKEYNVIDRQHLRAKEQLWINKLKCINQNNCLRLKEKHLNKQWREENKEHIKQYNKQWEAENKEHRKEYRKQYRAENREYIKQYQKQYNSQKIYCDVCDVYIRKDSKSRHLRTQKHIKNLSLKSDIIV